MQAICRIAILGAAACGAVSALAGEAPAPAAPRELLQPPKMSIASPITDRFAVRGTFYMSKVATDLRYDSSTGVAGTPLSGEDTLGFPGKLNQGGVDMVFRILDRHRIHADFFKLTRSGDQVINQSIRFGDDVYQVNDRVLTSMDLRKLGLTYTYSFWRSERLEIGMGLALHLLQLEGALDAPARFVRESLDVAGPFATLAGDVSWRVTKRFSLNVAGDYLGGNVKDVEGGYQSYRGDVQFRAQRNLTFGLGYSHIRYKIDSRDPTFLGYFSLKHSGPEAFVQVSF
jgi:hypothetical protein